MGSPSQSWSTQQLVEFLAVVSGCLDIQSASQAAVEHAAEALEADIGAVVSEGRVVASTGFPADAVPVAELLAAAGAPSAVLELPWGGSCSCASVPVDDDTGGRLLLARSGTASFGAEESSLLRAMARALALSFRSLRLVASLDERQHLLERLTRIQRSILERTELQDVLNAAVDGARELLGDDVAVLRLIDDEDPESLVLASSSGIAAELAAQIQRSSITHGATGRAVATGQLVVAHGDLDLAGTLAAMRPQELGAAIAAPVRENGTVTGSLVVASRRPGREYSASEQEVLTAFAEHASLALTDARNYQDARHQALYDGLTGLPNRTLLLERLHEIREAPTAGPQELLFLDLDDFKAVNDTLGHPVGDRLLRHVADRLRRCVREHDTVARFGGDEFAILLTDAAPPHDWQTVAQRILAAISEPFELAERQVAVGASIGIVHGAGDPEELLRNADLAMYHAKGRGRHRYEVFRPALRTAMLEHVAVTDALGTAIEGGELRAHYQPILDLESSAVIGVEALVRWQHPKRGLLAPAAFIPIAEQSGQVVALGRWMLFEACAQAAEWRDVVPMISVNLSAQQLREPSLTDDVAEALGRSGLAPEALTLEITETVLMADTAQTIRCLQDLKRLGVRIAADDFGTGYSSLQYLARFPLDALKIPRPFVDGVDGRGVEAAVVRSIVYLGQSFGLDVIAEGIETEAQHAGLTELGCRRGQGYLFARPMEPGAARRWLDERGAEPPLRVAA